VAYGSAYRDHYARLGEGGVSATIDGFEVRHIHGTLLIVTPFLSSIGMNGKIPMLARIISRNID
jgi:hypothetical protein